MWYTHAQSLSQWYSCLWPLGFRGASLHQATWVHKRDELCVGCVTVICATLEKGRMQCSIQ